MNDRFLSLEKSAQVGSCKGFLSGSAAPLHRCRWAVGGLMLLVMGTGSLSAAPFVDFNYNETGTSAANSGTSGGTSTLYDSTNTPADLHSAGGTGVSGQPGDRAFNLTSSTGIGAASPYQNAGFISAINGLQSFSITGWFRTDGAVLAQGSRLLDFAGETANSGFVLWSSVEGTLTLNVNGVGGSLSAGEGLFSTAGQWVFFAVTYDGTSSTNNLNFYAGTSATSPFLATTSTFNQGAVNTNPGSTPLIIGNNFYGNRGFDGYLDNIAIYGSSSDASGALNLSGIQSVYASNMANVPEPSIVSSLFLASIAIILGLKRRRYKLTH